MAVSKVLLASVAIGTPLDQARRFWTPKRMREAQALPVHLPGNADLADGAPGSTPPPACMTSSGVASLLSRSLRYREQAGPT